MNALRLSPLKKCHRTLAIAGLAGFLSLWSHNPSACAQQAAADFRPVRVLAALPAITDAPIKHAREVGGALNPSELVIGVTIGKESRAYPINMLTGPRREIINDKLGGKAIAATW